MSQTIKIKVLESIFFLELLPTDSFSVTIRLKVVTTIVGLSCSKGG